MTRHIPFRPIALNIKPQLYLENNTCWDVAIRTILDYHGVDFWALEPWSLLKKYDLSEIKALPSHEEFEKITNVKIDPLVFFHIKKLLPIFPDFKRGCHSGELLRSLGFRKTRLPFYDKGFNAEFVHSLLIRRGPIYTVTSVLFGRSHANVIFATDVDNCYFQEGYPERPNQAYYQKVDYYKIQRYINYHDLWYYQPQKKAHILKEKKKFFSDFDYAMGLPEVRKNIKLPPVSKIIFPVKNNIFTLPDYFMRFLEEEEQIDYLDKKKIIQELKKNRFIIQQIENFAYHPRIRRRLQEIKNSLQSKSNP